MGNHSNARAAQRLDKSGGIWVAKWAEHNFRHGKRECHGKAKPQNQKCMKPKTSVKSAGVVFLAGEILLIKPDQLVMLSATDSFTTVPVIGELILTKFTP